MSYPPIPPKPEFTESPEPARQPGEPYKEGWIVCVPMPAPKGEWYVDSVEVRRPGAGGMEAELFRDPLKNESYPTKEEAHGAGIEYGRGIIDSRS